MNEILHSQDQISIAYFVKEVNDLFGKNGNILQKTLFEVGIELAEIIQASLDSRNKLRRVNNESPRSTPPVAVDRDIPMISPELLGWSIAILASAWRELVFASKSEENSKYQTDPNYKNYPDRQAAIVNVKLAVPYVQCTIIDAIYKARQIGRPIMNQTQRQTLRILASERNVDRILRILHCVIKSFRIIISFPDRL